MEYRINHSVHSLRSVRGFSKPYALPRDFSYGNLSWDLMNEAQTQATSWIQETKASPFKTSACSSRNLSQLAFMAPVHPYTLVMCLGAQMKLSPDQSLLAYTLSGGDGGGEVSQGAVRHITSGRIWAELPGVCSMEWCGNQSLLTTIPDHLGRPFKVGIQRVDSVALLVGGVACEALG